MADFDKMREGIKILDQYECGGDEVYAEHDQFWLGDVEKSKRVMHKSDLNRLEELGWFEDEGLWSFFT